MNRVYELNGVWQDRHLRTSLLFSQLASGTYKWVKIQATPVEISMNQRPELIRYLVSSVFILGF